MLQNQPVQESMQNNKRQRIHEDQSGDDSLTLRKSDVNEQLTLLS